MPKELNTQSLGLGFDLELLSLLVPPAQCWDYGLHYQVLRMKPKST